MPGENLTRLEAQERAGIIDVESYDVTLDLTTGPETFRSTTIVRFSTHGGTATFIDAITSEIHSITLNGSAIWLHTVYFPPLFFHMMQKRAGARSDVQQVAFLQTSFIFYKTSFRRKCILPHFEIKPVYNPLACFCMRDIVF